MGCVGMLRSFVSRSLDVSGAWVKPEPNVKELLFLGVPDRLRRVEAPLAGELAAGFAAWSGPPNDFGLCTAGHLALFLDRHANEVADRIASLHDAYARFTAGHGGALDQAERRGHILDFAHTHTLPAP